jgi:hypothetical protein
MKYQKTATHHTGTTLSDAMRLWSTSKAITGGQQWLTPSANEDAAGTLGGKMQRMLSPQAQETPQGGDDTSGDTPQPRRRLNPIFVEALMGWPMGWTCVCAAVENACASVETGSCQ